MRVCDIRITGRRENGQTSFKYDDINYNNMHDARVYYTHRRRPLIFIF